MVRLDHLIRFLLRQNANGQTEVVDMATGMVRFTGSSADAQAVRDRLMQMTRRAS